MRQLEAARGHEFGFRIRRTIDGGTISFGLEKRPGRLRSTAMAPYLHGTLQADPASGGTIIVGSFGFHPAARAGAIFIAVIAVIGISNALYRGGQHGVEGTVVVVGVGIAGLLLTRWTRRGDRREITAFLTQTLQATSIDSASTRALDG